MTNGRTELADKCWYELDIDIGHALKDSWTLPPEPIAQNLWHYTPQKIFRDSWIEEMTQRYVYLDSAMLFYKAPYLNTHRAHLDRDGDNLARWAINWTITEDTSEMIWYAQPNDDVPYFTPSADPQYREWDSRLLREIDRTTISIKPTLIRVDIPHEIKAIKLPRWCISIRGGAGRTRFSSDWHDVVEDFRQLGLICER